MRNDYVLKCQNPPTEWMEGFPTGNGRIAAMLWGDKEDIISLNHEWLWTGKYRHRDNGVIPKEVLPQIRKLIDDGEYFKATAIAAAWLGGAGGGTGIRGRIDSYQPVGDLRFCFFEENKYGTRTLDILNAVAIVCRQDENGNKITTTHYVDICEDVAVCKWNSEKAFSGKLCFSRPEDNEAEVKYTYNENEIIVDGTLVGEITFKVRVDIVCDGRLKTENDGITITEAKELLAVVSIAVSKDAKENIEIPRLSYDFEKMHKQHQESFAKEMSSFQLSVDVPDNEAYLEQRIELLKQGEEDDSLMMLFYNLGRYLMLSSSLKGELPANLQGKWNRDIDPPWYSDYHFDINLEMNYWFAEPLGMGTCAEKLLNLIDVYIPHAKTAAKDLYNCRGVWFPLSGDVWGRATPENYAYGVWIGAAAWMAQHYWLRYIYSGDKEFLAKRAYPFLKEVALFYTDYVTQDEDGIYQISPSQSPENAFEGVGYFAVAICKSAAMDVQLAYDALGYAIDAAEILDTDAENVLQWKKIRENLPEFKIGSDGRLLEWNSEKTEKDPAHRHLSHLYGLYPSKIFTEESYQKQYDAAKESLDFRVLKGVTQCGWSRSWIACLYAALGDGEKMREHILKLLSEYVTSSLLDTHPDYHEDRTLAFQIDGNFGAVAAITESIVQYKNNKLYLIPALPRKWENGEVRGYKTPGGHTICFAWKDKRIYKLCVTLGYAENIDIVFNNETYKVNGREGEEVVIL